MSISKLRLGYSPRSGNLCIPPIQCDCLSSWMCLNLLLWGPCRTCSLNPWLSIISCKIGIPLSCISCTLVWTLSAPWTPGSFSHCVALERIPSWLNECDVLNLTCLETFFSQSSGLHRTFPFLIRWTWFPILLITWNGQGSNTDWIFFGRRNFTKTISPVLRSDSDALFWSLSACSFTLLSYSSSFRRAFWYITFVGMLNYSPTSGILPFGWYLRIISSGV